MERRWHSGQQLSDLPDGSLEAALHVEGRTEVIAWVLSYGSEAELLAPADLPDEIREHLRATLLRYES